MSASDSSSNRSTMSSARACWFRRRRRRPERSTAPASCRPFSVCRGRRHRVGQNLRDDGKGGSRLHRLGSRRLAGAKARYPFAPERPAPMPDAVRFDRERFGYSKARPALSDSKIARARSASSRSTDPASARNPSRCSAVATTRGRPAMVPPKSSGLHLRFCHMWMIQGNPA